MAAPVADTPVLSLEVPALRELSERRQWVCWRYEQRDSKWTKVPYQPGGLMASSTNPHTWNTLGAVYQTALGTGQGIGFVFNGDIAGIDLDKCRDPRTGVIETWALDIIARLDSYTEVSPSGGGVHILCRGQLPEDGGRRGKIEVYVRGRYFTMTGRHLDGTPDEIRDSSEALEWLWSTHVRAAASRTSASALPSVEAQEFPWGKFDAIMENDSKFRASWLHKRSDFDDQSLSTYDLSLCMIAAMSGWNDGELASLIVKHREKWGETEKARRQDYLNRTIANVRGKLAARTEGAGNDRSTLGQMISQARAEEVMDHGQDAALRELRLRLRIPVDKVLITGEQTAIAYSFVLDDGRRIAIGDAGAVLNQAVVRKVIFGAAGVVVPTIKQSAWDGTAMVLQAAAEREDAADSDPVKELLSAIEDYADPPTAWDDEDGAAAFNAGAPLLRNGRMMITVRHFMRWCQGRGVMLTLRDEDIRSRLRAAGWKGDKVSRRCGVSVKNLFYWSCLTPFLTEKQ